MGVAPTEIGELRTVPKGINRAFDTVKSHFWHTYDSVNRHEETRLLDDVANGSD